jgi:Bacterial extracellular solute-binding protein/von Willebrand factor type A domain
VNSGRAGTNPGSKGRRGRRVSIKILVALAVVVSAGLMVTLTASAKATRTPCAAHPVRASVAVSPDIAPAVTTVSQLFNRQHHLVGTSCADIRIVSAASGPVAAVLDGQGSASGLPAVSAWIPDSTLWVDVARSFPVGARVVQPSGIHVAQSPLMIVMPPNAAARVPAFGASIGWNFLLPASDGGPPSSQHLRVNLPDPAQSSAGLATLVEIRRLVGNGAAARTAFARFVFASEPTSQSPGPQELTPFITLAQPPLNGNPVTVTSEQEVLQYDRAHPDQPLAARYPLSSTAALGSPELDYPYVVTSFQPAATQAVRQFGKLLGQSYAAGVVRFDGFRSGKDVADVAPSQYGLASQLLRVATPALASEAQSALQAWQRLGVEARDLALIDVSGAMASPAGPGGVTLEQEVARAAGLGLALFPDNTSMGLWEYAHNLTGSQPYKQLVPVGPLTGELGLISRRQQLLEANQALKPVTNSPAALNKAILAGYKHMTASYQPKYANAVLVLTSGADNARDDISLSKLLDELHHLYNPDRPVEIVIVMFGTHGNFSAMRQIAAATAGTAYEITEPTQIGKVFFEAIAQRICASSCATP